MISLQSHNQVLYHLTQFTSVISPRSTPFVIPIKKQNDSGNKITESILCKSSFLEAIKSCKELCIDKLNVQNLATPLRISKNDILKILEQLSKKESSGSLTKNKWKESYVSGISFNENKKNSYAQLTDTINLSTVYLYTKPQYRFLHKFCSSVIYPNSLQVKYFKTYRSIKEDVIRNPPLSVRFRKWMESDGIDDGSKQKTTNVFSKKPVEIDKLRKSQNDKYIKVGELQHIKAAFAEGYLAGHDQKHNGWTFKALKFTQQIFVTLLLVVLVVVLMGAYKSMTGGGVFKIQMSNKVEVNPEDIQITFNDVKGVEEAKSELLNIVEFLRNPNKFSALGGKLPKGVLLVGPPGTGKTLLARAVAGEAGVPFFHAAGPEFDEILVGQGARRVRELFKSAKERAPCVIFIDEIDSVGGQRTHSAIHPYANQTINQLLSEMDGFHRNEGVIVLGATNRRQDLDKALLRPGRFDSEILVRAPDYFGRMEILELYLTRILARDINTEVLAKRTIGFTGADIENMINQAALKAAIEGAEYVTMDHIEQARDKVIMGPEGRRRAINDEENILTAYHEGGHVLVSYFTKEAPPLHKVTIIPRGHSMGHVSSICGTNNNLIIKFDHFYARPHICQIKICII
ncbi:PREDICTED: ATP-dependent zinc metalloprotease YME1 homolog isoform X1 [Ceratosolen solmsi marchali]|uniref:ATP-dependent zinc metalloprotease YME1 homolog isoform X1 n=1 Tax=Ceratosolen solmsi marchali TaxID=326594 RepID=A0AAJ6VM74_9HYME|nr:PREDICTED: ATP-dependent zinc metalloprotease YME1 homolog isoform X1 [Ceratosolen solmsi marchali]